LVFGEPGVGKSTFGAGWPAPLFIDAEKRTEHLDINRIEVDTWAEVLGVMAEVSAKKTPVKTLVFDTVDHMELMIYDQLCKDYGCNSIEDYKKGFGKIYTDSLDQWRLFILELEKLRDKGITCLLLAHGHIKTFRNPTGEDYDRWQLKMNVKAANFLREKMDAVGFAHFEDFTEEDNKKNHKAQTTGDRMLAFSHSPAYESKRGINLPDEVKLSYEAFMEGRKENG
jgi:hypothetical protein